MAKALMVQGCTSSAGKSYLTAAICRILANEGVRVAPFKAQNMSNNAGVTKDNLEMGRAQIVQAQACKLEPEVRMNPVLLKPEADTRSQVVVLGKPDFAISKLPWGDRKGHLWQTVKTSLHALLEDFEVVVIEGAGSPAEINLRESDIVNMSVALEVQANVLLVSDIDRGGSFAHLLGTWQCCSSEERALMKGFILNRFRGDANLLSPAPEWLESQTNVPTVGVVPMLKISLPEEDALMLEHLKQSNSDEVAIVAFPRISNLDEFAPLANLARWVRVPTELKDAKAIILPGSKSTNADLEWLRATGLAGAISRAANAGVQILGVCGGMQMLGNLIKDPLELEGTNEVRGLGLLDLETVFEASKVTRATQFYDLELDLELNGYEIHLGRSTGNATAILKRASEILGWRNGNVRGVYAHGLLENPAYLAAFLQRAGIQYPTTLETLDSRLDAIAARVKEALDWQRIKSWLA